MKLNTLILKMTLWPHTCRDEEHGALQQKLAEAGAQLAEADVKITRQSTLAHEQINELTQQLVSVESAVQDTSRERTALQTKLSFAEEKLQDLSPLARAAAAREAEVSSLAEQVRQDSRNDAHPAQYCAALQYGTNAYLMRDQRLPE